MSLLVTDLDRTLTGDDLLPDPRALERVAELRAVGVRVILATGRTLEHLDEEGLASRFDAVVAENGAIVVVPGRDLMEVRGISFARTARDALDDLGDRFRWGRVLGSGAVALAEEATTRLAAADVRHRLEMNHDEVMLLPEGVDKATGAARAAQRLGERLSRSWAVGDGENDASLLRAARTGVALGNAVPAARAAAKVLVHEHGADGFLAVTSSLLRRRAQVRA